MDKIQAYLPSGEKGYLPYYLFVVCDLPQPSNRFNHSRTPN